MLNIYVLLGRAQQILFHISKLVDEVNDFDVPLNVHSPAAFAGLLYTDANF